MVPSDASVNTAICLKSAASWCCDCSPQVLHLGCTATQVGSSLLLGGCLGSFAAKQAQAALLRCACCCGPARWHELRCASSLKGDQSSLRGAAGTGSLKAVIRKEAITWQARKAERQKVVPGGANPSQEDFNGTQALKTVCGVLE